jgi:lactate dehydrogenase-like 2-hydroxyacid dehydrogenase
MKPKVIFTSNVFSADQIGKNDKISSAIRDTIRKLWEKLNFIAEIKIFNDRFVPVDYLEKEIKDFNPHIIGCHLSHPIGQKIQKNSNLFAISTSTAGYNHIHRLEDDNILITHTPGVLHETVADYTVALIMANLRNVIDLHIRVWDGKWAIDDKWDLDQDLSSMIRNKILGIIGMGEIGYEVLKLLSPWGIKINYYDLRRRDDVEKNFPGVEYIDNMDDIFRYSDIVSLHIPLNKHTEDLIDKNFMKLMKPNSLLINTARGGILKLNDLLDLLETGEKIINFSFDVFPNEPLDKKTLLRFKKIKEKYPNIRMVLMPHNASADANTRGKMVTLFLKDIIDLIESSNKGDLTKIHIIPEQKKMLDEKNWKIYDYWKEQL